MALQSLVGIAWHNGKRDIYISHIYIYIYIYIYIL